MSKLLDWTVQFCSVPVLKHTPIYTCLYIFFFFSYRRLPTFRPGDSELDEYYPKASRLLHVGNLPRETVADDLRSTFGSFGEILEMDMNKKGNSATIQFLEVSNVVDAIKAMDGAPFRNSGFKLKLAFARPVPTKCVWVQGLSVGVTEKMLYAEFERFGKIKDNDVKQDKKRGTALVYYEDVSRV